MIKRITIILATIACIGCTHAQHYNAADNALRHEIGQMIVVGFRGTDIDANSHIVRDIRDYGVGGVILFEYDAPSHSRPRNITSRQQLKRLCEELQQLSDSMLLIGIDQEGGTVTRLKERYGFPAFASAKKTAADGTDSVRHYARLTAMTLGEIGVNLNFAPCVDVDINPACPVIGKIGRSFSNDWKKVAECAAIWIEEQQSRGVTACLKHFPGHGSSRTDTHLGLADVSDTWQPCELEPYRQLIARGDVRMIMTTHVFNAVIDSVFPATLSHRTLTTLLRDSLHYDGVVITDDLAMGAMTQQYTLEEILRQSILAGADLLCLSNNGEDYNPDIVPQAVEIIYDLVRRGDIPAERIHESNARISRLKKDMQNR